MARFYYPLLTEFPYFMEPTKEVHTARFDFKDNSVAIVKGYIEKQVTIGGLSPDVALKAILDHEIGHYMIYPRECATFLKLQRAAIKKFGSKGQKIMAYYMDVVENLDQMLQAEKGRELRESYKADVRMLDHDKEETLRKWHEEKEKRDRVEKELKATGKKKELEALPPQGTLDEIVAAIDKHQAIDRTVISLYQEHTGEQFGVEGTKWILDKLKKIDFLNLDHGTANLIQFGDAVKGLFKEGGGGSVRGVSSGDFSDDQVDQALSDIARDHSKEMYDQILEQVEKDRNKKFGGDVPLRTLGIEGLTENNDQIAYYERIAKTYGLYIIKKRLYTHTDDNYPEGNVDYTPDDPIVSLNRFSSPTVMPSISKRKVPGNSQRITKKPTIPDLLIVIDSSASMPHPRDKSYAIAAGFILARNYHGNGAKVGVMNFSTKSACMLPSRDLEQAYMMLCAFWSQGTVWSGQNVEKYLQDSIDPEFKRRGLGKDESRLDTVIISDGGFINAGDIVRYFNDLKGISRNIVYLLNNQFRYNDWKEKGFAHTQLVHIKSMRDIISTAVGDVHSLTRRAV